MPPPAMRLSVLSAFVGSPDARYITTLVSKKLPGICLFAVEFEIGGQAATKSAKTVQQVFAAGPARYRQLARICDVDLDIVTPLQRQQLHPRGGKKDGKGISPIFDTPGPSREIQI